MALFIKTSNPQQLLKNIKEYIDEGHIETWQYDAYGDFTHTPAQWYGKAWFQPKIEVGQLAFGIIYPGQTSLSVTTYAIYHGRLAEMVLSHFDREFTSVYSSALLMNPDELKQ